MNKIFSGRVDDRRCVGWRIETGHNVHISGASGKYARDVGAVAGVVCGENFGHRKRCHSTIGTSSCTGRAQRQGKVETNFCIRGKKTFAHTQSKWNCANLRVSAKCEVI